MKRSEQTRLERLLRRHDSLKKQLEAKCRAALRSEDIATEDFGVEVYPQLTQLGAIVMVFRTHDAINKKGRIATRANLDRALALVEGTVAPFLFKEYTLTLKEKKPATIPIGKPDSADPDVYELVYSRSGQR